MLDPAFSQQIWLSIIDKLLLGGVAGSLGFIASKYLEDYRSRQTIRIEIARKRVEILASIWSEISSYEDQAFKQTYTLAVILLGALKEAEIAPQDEELPNAADEALAQLAKYGERALPDPILARVDEQIQPHTLALFKKGVKLKELISSNRFWLGSQLTGELNDYCDSLAEAFGRLSPAHDDRLRFQRAFADLVRRKADAQSLGDRLLKA